MERGEASRNNMRALLRSARNIVGGRMKLRNAHTYAGLISLDRPAYARDFTSNKSSVRRPTSIFKEESKNLGVRAPLWIFNYQDLIVSLGVFLSFASANDSKRITKKNT